MEKRIIRDGFHFLEKAGFEANYKRITYTCFSIIYKMNPWTLSISYDYQDKQLSMTLECPTRVFPVNILKLGIISEEEIRFIDRRERELNELRMKQKRGYTKTQFKELVSLYANALSESIPEMMSHNVNQLNCPPDEFDFTKVKSGNR